MSQAVTLEEGDRENAVTTAEHLAAVLFQKAVTQEGERENDCEH
jgi:hypothetical protein